MSIKWIAFQPLIGGMAIGAENAFGCLPTCVLDYEGVANSELYMDYLKKRKKEVPHYKIKGNLFSLCEDLGDQKEAFLEAAKDVDVVTGVPICSGLSQANCQNSESSSMGRGSDALQNNNMIGMLNFTFKYIKPKAYIFENAYQLATTLGADLLKKLTSIANEAGYATTLVKVNTMNHGIPQNRKRCFFIAWKGEEAYKLIFKKAPDRTVTEVLAGLPPQKCEYLLKKASDNGWIKYVKWHYRNEPDWRKCWEESRIPDATFIMSEFDEFDEAEQFFQDEPKMIEHIRYCKMKKAQGKGWYSKAPKYFGNKKMCSIYRRSIWATLHPTEDRGYSLREFMRMMGMPDDFDEPEMKNDGMVGQNVPVCTAQYYCEQVKLALEGKLEKSGMNVIQDFTTEKNANPKKEQKKESLPKTSFQKIFS